MADTVNRDVATRDVERGFTRVCERHLRVRQRERARDPDTPRSRAEVENACGLIANPRAESGFDQLGDRRARYQHGRHRSSKRWPANHASPDQIRYGDPFRDSSSQQLIEPRAVRRSVSVRDGTNESNGVRSTPITSAVASSYAIVRAVSEPELVPRELIRDPLERVAQVIGDSHLTLPFAIWGSLPTLGSKVSASAPSSRCASAARAADRSRVSRRTPDRRAPAPPASVAWSSKSFESSAKRASSASASSRPTSGCAS